MGQSHPPKLILTKEAHRFGAPMIPVKSIRTTTIILLVRCTCFIIKLFLSKIYYIPSMYHLSEISAIDITKEYVELDIGATVFEIGGWVSCEAG